MALAWSGKVCMGNGCKTFRETQNGHSGPVMQGEEFQTYADMRQMVGLPGWVWLVCGGAETTPVVQFYGGCRGGGRG